MLNFYAFRDLRPWPEDLPADGRYIGGLDDRDYRTVASVMEPTLRELGIQGSYSSDWIVPTDKVATFIQNLHRSCSVLTESQIRNIEQLILLVSKADGASLLAVCD